MSDFISQVTAAMQEQREKAGVCIITKHASKAQAEKAKPTAQPRGGPSSSTSSLGKRPAPAGTAPKKEVIQPPVEPETQTIVQRLMGQLRGIPVVGTLVKRTVNSYTDMTLAWNGADDDEIEADRQARQEPSRGTGKKEDPQLISDDENAGVSQDPDEADKLLQKLSETPEDEEDEEADPTSPAKRAKTNKLPQLMLGPVEYNTYIRLAKAMDSTHPKEEHIWHQELGILFPGMKKITDVKTGAVKRAHIDNWGLPAYLICLGMPLSTTAAALKAMIAAYNRWITDKLKTTPEDWDGSFDPPGLAEDEA